jgi:hypothetical protein
MESRIIQLSDAAHKYGNLNIACCGEEFFPGDAIGGSTKKLPGVPISLKVQGLPAPIETDIPRHKKSGKPRWMFRKRGWVKDFVRCQRLGTDDRIRITRVDGRTYEVSPENGRAQVDTKKGAVPGKVPIDSIVCGDCEKVLSDFPEDSVDLIGACWSYVHWGNDVTGLT